MSNPRSGGEGHAGGGNDPSLAKTAGFLVFSGIALSILKTLNPLNKNRTASSSESLAGPAQPIREVPPPLPPPPQPQPQPHSSCEPIIKPSVEIVKGDTLWGLSQNTAKVLPYFNYAYKVSVDAIKEANGLTGDTIYAGRKLIIPQ